MSCGLKNEEIKNICDEDGAHYYYNIMYTRFIIYKYTCMHNILDGCTSKTNYMYMYACSVES